MTKIIIKSSILNRGQEQTNRSIRGDITKHQPHFGLTIVSLLLGLISVLFIFVSLLLDLAKHKKKIKTS